MAVNVKFEFGSLAHGGPETLNGYPVVKSVRHPSGCYTVVVERPQGWVVATWWPDLKSTWSWGHYVDVRDAADKHRVDTIVELNREYTEVLIRNGNRR